MLPGRRAIGLAKSLEDVRQECRIDPLSRVTDNDLDLLAVVPQVDIDRATGGRELDCVGEKVPHDLL